MCSVKIIQMRIFLRILFIVPIQVSNSNKILLRGNLPGLLYEIFMFSRKQNPLIICVYTYIVVTKVNKSVTQIKRGQVPGSIGIYRITGSVEIAWVLLECETGRISEPAPERTCHEARKAWETGEHQPELRWESSLPFMYPSGGFHLLKAVCPPGAWGCTPHGGHREEKLVAMASAYRGAIIWKVMFLIWGHLGGCNRNFPRRLMTGISPKEVLVCGEPVRSCLSLGLLQRQTENSLIIQQLGAKKKRQMEAEDTQSSGLQWSFGNTHLWKNSVGEMCPKFWQGWEAMNLGKICWWGRNRGIFYLTTLPWHFLFFHQHIQWQNYGYCEGKGNTTEEAERKVRRTCRVQARSGLELG